MKSLRLVVAVLAISSGVSTVAWAQCSSGTYQCGPSHCVPNGSVCCASAGYPGRYCPGGQTCTSDGRCSTGGGGGCDPGTYQCGTSWCVASGRVCCASVGHPDMSCPGGTVCTTSGTCSSGGGGGSGGGSCDPGTYQCGSSWCIPSGSVCCASVGNPDKYCPGGTVCTTDGRCSSGGGGGSGGSGGGCDNSCQYANDGACDDGRPGAAFNVCAFGTDCSDCAGVTGGSGGGAGGSGGGSCSNTCQYANDGTCDDGRPGARFSLCSFGTDCADCAGLGGGGSSGGFGGSGGSGGSGGDGVPKWGCSTGAGTLAWLWPITLLFRRRRGGA